MELGLQCTLFYFSILQRDVGSVGRKVAVAAANICILVVTSNILHLRQSLH